MLLKDVHLELLGAEDVVLLSDKEVDVGLLGQLWIRQELCLVVDSVLRGENGCFDCASRRFCTIHRQRLFPRTNCCGLEAVKLRL